MTSNSEIWEEFGQFKAKFPKAALCARKYDWSLLKCIKQGKRIDLQLQEQDMPEDKQVNYDSKHVFACDGLSRVRQLSHCWLHLSGWFFQADFAVAAIAAEIKAEKVRFRSQVERLFKMVKASHDADLAQQVEAVQRWRARAISTHVS